MVGQGGLGEMEPFQQHAGTLLALPEQFQNPESAVIGDGFQQQEPFVFLSIGASLYLSWSMCTGTV